MYKGNPQGFHTSLTPDVHQRIIAAIPRVYTPRLIASLARIPRQTLQYWLKRGAEESEQGLNTYFSALWVDYAQVLAESIEKLLDPMRQGEKNWQGSHEILKVAAREDFGVDAVEYKELVELYNRLLAGYQKLDGQGVLNNGELDSKCDQEAGSATESAEGQEG